MPKTHLILAMAQKDDFKLVAIVAAQFLVMLSMYMAVRHYIFGSPWTALFWETAFIAGLIFLGLLSRAIPMIDRAVNYGLFYYLLFTFMLFALLAPGVLFFKLAQWVAEAQNQTLKIVFFVVSGTLWIGLVSLLCPTRMQRKLFAFLKAFGWFTPLIFLFNYIAGSTVFFGFLAFFIFGPGVDGSLDSDSYLNLFGYHFLDSIPALKVTQTLNLEEPMSEARPLALGLMLLVFKLAVLIPAIGAFRAYWKSDAREDSA